MSSITGILLRNERKVDHELIKNMNDSLAYRGPDGSHVWSEGSVALGHQMLHTTLESVHEELPFINKDKKLAITADARIDNRQELLETFNLDESLKISDSYLILLAYNKWGERCPEKLLGDFTFAIWDGIQEKLFCARDHIGVKPFYYYLADDIFIFATEMKAIFSIPNIKKQINEEQIANFLASLYADQEITFYKNIFRLPPANSITILKDEIFIENYWSLNPDYELDLDSDIEYSDKFLEIFKEAVKCRLRAILPIGYTLSGGMDSSSVVCMASHILKNKTSESLKTFSNIFDGIPQADERYYINSIISERNIDPYFINAEQISPLDDIETMVWHIEEPFLAPNMFLLWSPYSEGKRKNIRIMLSGFDGDTVLHRNILSILTEDLYKWRWKKLLKEIDGVSDHLNIKRTTLIRRLFLEILMHEDSKRSNILSRFRKKNFSRTGVMNKKFLSQNNIEHAIEFFDEHYHHDLFNSRILHFRSLNSPLLQSSLEILDKSSAAFAIESRYPFFDKRLVEFCLALPSDQKMYAGWDRIVLRRAMENILPKEIQWRPKKSSMAPVFTRNLRLLEKEHLKEILFDNSSVIEKYVNLEKIQIKYYQFMDKEPINVTNLWKVVNLWYFLNSIK